MSDDLQRRLLDEYARHTPILTGKERCAPLLQDACKMNANTTRYAIEDARRQKQMTGNTQRIRPIIKGTSPIVLAKDWINLSQAAPGTVQQLKPAALSMYTNQPWPALPSANGYYAVINFGKQISGKALFLFCGYYRGGVNMVLPTPGVFLSAGGSTTTGKQGGQIDIYPITASFATTVLTWNNFNTQLTLGALMSFDICGGVNDGTSQQIILPSNNINSSPVDGRSIMMFDLSHSLVQSLNNFYGLLLKFIAYAPLASGSVQGGAEAEISAAPGGPASGAPYIVVAA